MSNEKELLTPSGMKNVLQKLNTFADFSPAVRFDCQNRRVAANAAHEIQYPLYEGRERGQEIAKVILESTSFAEVIEKTGIAGWNEHRLVH